MSARAHVAGFDRTGPNHHGWSVKTKALATAALTSILAFVAVIGTTPWPIALTGVFGLASLLALIWDITSQIPPDAFGSQYLAAPDYHDDLQACRVSMGHEQGWQETTTRLLDLGWHATACRCRRLSLTRAKDRVCSGCGERAVYLTTAQALERAGAAWRRSNRACWSRRFRSWLR